MNKFAWNITINGILTGFLLWEATERIFITNNIELGLVFAALAYINNRITMHQIEMKHHKH